MSSIHPTAIVEDGARLGADVRIGAYSVVGAGVSLGDGVEIAPHVTLRGTVAIGARTRIGSFSDIGGPGQHLKALEREVGSVTVGADCVLREQVTINAGMLSDDLATTVGDRCFLMVGAHVAHDCVVGNEVIITNQGTLGGHVVMGDGAILGGLSAVHQFTRVGAYSFTGGISGLVHDLIPFGMANGQRAHLEGFNIIGLKRRGVSRAQIHEMRAAYRDIFESGDPLSVALGRYPEDGTGNAMLDEILAFLRADSKRRYCVPERD